MDYLPPKRSPEPTRIEFERFLRFLAPAEENAWQSYLKLQEKLKLYFEVRRLSPSADLADEVINRLIKKVTEVEQIQDVNRYAYGIARYLRLEIYRQPLKLAVFQDKTSDEGINELASPLVTEDVKMNCVEKCLEKQPLDKMELLLDFYTVRDGETQIEHRKKMARDYAAASRANLSAEQIGKRSALNMEELEKVEKDALDQAVSRIRRDVKSCALECYQAEINPTRQNKEAKR
jgi:hypothetical protein